MAKAIEHSLDFQDIARLGYRPTRERATINIITEVSMKESRFTIKLENVEVLNCSPSQDDTDTGHSHNRDGSLTKILWTLMEAHHKQMGFLLTHNNIAIRIRLIVKHPFEVQKMTTRWKRAFGKSIHLLEASDLAAHGSAPSRGIWLGTGLHKGNRRLMEIPTRSQR